MTSPTPPDPLTDLPFAEQLQPSEACTRAIRERCTRDLSCRRGPSAALRLGSSLLIVVGCFAVVLWVGRNNAGTDPRLASGLLGAVGWGVVMVSALVFGLMRPPGQRWPRGVRLATAALLPLSFVGLLALSAGDPGSFGEFWHRDTSHHAVTCLLFATLFGAVTAAGVLAVWRGTDPLTPRISGAIAGFVGGTSSALAVGVVCPTSEAWHVIASHGLIVLTLTLGGALVGRRALAP